MNKFSLIAAATLLAAASSFANAAVVYWTNFTAPTYSDGPLLGQDSWALTGTTTTNPQSVANSATNGIVALTTSGQDVNRVFTPAQTASNTTSVYLQSLLTVTAAQATGDYFLHLGDGGASNFFARIYARAGTTAGTYQLAMGTSSGTAVNYGPELALGTAITLLARYDFVAGTANDTGALFVNPTNPLGVGDTAYIAATTIGADAASISSVNLRQGTAGSAPTVTIDSLLVDGFVPEPATLGLIAAGAVVALRRRK
jgi:trimeric autotransporter adhesin